MVGIGESVPPPYPTFIFCFIKAPALISKKEIFKLSVVSHNIFRGPPNLTYGFLFLSLFWCVKWGAPKNIVSIRQVVFLFSNNQFIGWALSSFSHLRFITKVQKHGNSRNMFNPPLMLWGGVELVPSLSFLVSCCLYSTPCVSG